jgi:hypothetical protein
MATTPLFADRVQETSTTTGTGTYTLAGAVTGYQTFAAIGDGVSCYYCAMEVDGNGNPSGGWEVGVGTYTSSGTTLSRDSILASTNSNNAVSWSAGTRRIFVTMTAVTAVQASAGLAPTAEGRIGFDTTQHALVAGGQGTISGKIPRVLSLAADTTDTLSAATISTTETAFTKTFTIPANFFIANKGLKIFSAGNYTSSGSPPTSVIRIRLGGISGTVVYLSNTLAPVVNRTAEGWGFEVYIIGTAAPGASVAVLTVSPYSIGGAGQVPPTNNRTAVSQNVATNGSLSLVVSAQFSANTAGNSWTQNLLMVEELN